jgi:hypothetical protein
MILGSDGWILFQKRIVPSSVQQVIEHVPPSDGTHLSIYAISKTHFMVRHHQMVK